MRVISGGNVGIGTATPAVPLHITKSAVGDNQIPDYNIIDEVASHCFVPLTIGGNIKSLYDVQKIINCFIICFNY